MKPICKLKIAAALSMAGTLAACTGNLLPYGRENEQRIHLEVLNAAGQEYTEESGDTKGRFTASQINRITQLQVLIYQGGEFVDSYYFPDASEAVVTFPNYLEHNMYLLANMGEWTSPPKEESGLEEYAFTVEDYARFSTFGAPMVGVYKDFIPGSMSTFGLTRLVGCYAVTMTTSAGELDKNKATYVLKEGRIRQAAKVIRPFGHLDSTYGVDPEIYASKAMGIDEVYPADAASGGDGDYLSADDVAVLNSGARSICIFSRICRASRVRWRKTPIPGSRIRSMPDTCPHFAPILSFPPR